ncbi:MAG: biotin/lipoyl-binding protein [Gammaproteobacteria bacterium]|jgi:RND family efflux transporter MFP subunit|nr:biotin/lipoyl-binding protein [Gammaproteobacteria bacterium]
MNRELIIKDVSILSALLLSLLLWSSLVKAEEAVASIRLSLPLSGVIQEVWVKQGDRVKQGARLLRLDPRRFQYRLAAAEANLQVAEADREDSRRILAEQIDLFERMVTTENELRSAKLTAARVDARIAELQAVRDEAALNLELSELRAPRDGTILQRLAQPGEVTIAEQQPPVLLLLGREVSP